MMELMEERSTDKRLDALSNKVDRKFEQVDLRFEQVDLRFDHVDRQLHEVGQRFDRVAAELHGLGAETRTEFKALRGEMKAGFERMDERLDERFDALHRLLVQFSGLLLAALIGVIATQL